MPRLVGSLVIVLAAVVSMAFTTIWIRNKADALTPVDLPSAVPTPLQTVCPKGFLDPKIENGLITNTVGDTIPLLPAPWEEGDDRGVTYRGTGQMMYVHKNYSGTDSWVNMVGFGMFQPKEPFKATPAGIKYAAQLVGGRMVNQLYQGKSLPIKGTVTHRPLTIGGHKAYEITARVPINNPKLPVEKFSVLAILVVDRGNSQASVAWGDFSGTTYTKWLPVWRENVAKIKVNTGGGC